MQALPWYSPNGDVRGSIRLALDISDALAARGVLLRSMLVSGGVIALLALVTGLWLVRRALRPLTQNSPNKPEQLIPAHPALTSYQGPADEVADLALRAQRHPSRHSRTARSRTGVTSRNCS